MVEPEAADAIQRGRGEHILLIDDEPPMADMGRRLLTQLGYQVTAFTQPQEALERFMADPQEFDLVMTDMNMPRLSGLDLARAVHASDARTPILLVSGHLAGEQIPPNDETGIRAMLAKPFTARQLSATLRRILDAATA
jgi:CheY-like chemotaxis protein